MGGEKMDSKMKTKNAPAVIRTRVITATTWCTDQLYYSGTYSNLFCLLYQAEKLFPRDVQIPRRLRDNMSLPDNRYYVDQHVAAQWADDTYRSVSPSLSRLDSGIIQQIRERVNSDGSKEYEYYIHYIDCMRV